MDLPLPAANLPPSNSQTHYDPDSPDKKKMLLIIAGIVISFGILAFVSGFLLAPPATVSNKSTTTSQKTKTLLTKNGSTVSAPSKNTSPKVPTPTATDLTYYYSIATEIPATPTFTPTPTPLAGNFYIPNGKQNDLIIKIWQNNDWDIVDDVQLINTKIKETRLIGRANAFSLGDSAFFYQNYSMVIFIGSTPGDKDLNKISLYSIPRNKIVKQYTITAMKKTIPALQINQNAILGRLFISPDGIHAAVSYGEDFSTEDTIDPNTSIIAIDLHSDQMQLLAAKGLIKGWKDNKTIIYQTQSADPTDPEAEEIAIQ